MDLINSQLILIDKIKNLIKKSKNKGLPVFKIATFYFAPYGNSKGYAKIIFEQNKLKGLILTLEIFLKDLSDNKRAINSKKIKLLKKVNIYTKFRHFIKLREILKN